MPVNYMPQQMQLGGQIAPFALQQQQELGDRRRQAKMAAAQGVAGGIQGALTGGMAGADWAKKQAAQEQQYQMRGAEEARRAELAPLEQKAAKLRMEEAQRLAQLGQAKHDYLMGSEEGQADPRWLSDLKAKREREGEMYGLNKSLVEEQLAGLKKGEERTIADRKRLQQERALAGERQQLEQRFRQDPNADVSDVVERLAGLGITDQRQIQNEIDTARNAAAMGIQTDIQQDLARRRLSIPGYEDAHADIQALQQKQVAVNEILRKYQDVKVAKARGIGPFAPDAEKYRMELAELFQQAGEPILAEEIRAGYDLTGAEWMGGTGVSPYDRMEKAVAQLVSQHKNEVQELGQIQPLYTRDEYLAPQFQNVIQAAHSFDPNAMSRMNPFLRQPMQQVQNPNQAFMTGGMQQPGMGGGVSYRNIQSHNQMPAGGMPQPQQPQMQAPNMQQLNPAMQQYIRGQTVQPPPQQPRQQPVVPTAGLQRGMPTSAMGVQG